MVDGYATQEARGALALEVWAPVGCEAVAEEIAEVVEQALLAAGNIGALWFALILSAVGLC